MASNPRRLVMVRPQARTYYERWVAGEGIPVVEGLAVPDVCRIPLRRWKRLGCEGAYLQLAGSQGITGAYIGKIAPGAMTEPEKHLYEKCLYMLRGEGVAEVQQRNRVPQAFTWKEGSLFSPPINATHRLTNHSNKPAVFFAVTTAPVLFDHFHNERFVFGNDFSFSERYDGEPDYFEGGELRYLSAHNRQWVSETNFIGDVRREPLSACEQEGAAVRMMQFELAHNTLTAQLAQCPVAEYHKAQYQSGGTVFLTLSSKGYSLMWPAELGRRPYENGLGEKILRVDWGPGTVFSPPSHWLHQHFNTGDEPAVHLMLGCGSQKFPFGVALAPLDAGVYSSVKQSRTSIEDDDEDPGIRRQFAAELRRSGIDPGVNLDTAANDK